jgi:hypothetical protein
MQPPLNALTPALAILSKKIKILPAADGAMEDLERPDVEELEDVGSRS